jgi:hypothetical protein
MTEARPDPLTVNTDAMTQPRWARLLNDREDQVFLVLTLMELLDAELTAHAALQKVQPSGTAAWIVTGKLGVAGILTLDELQKDDQQTPTKPLLDRIPAPPPRLARNNFRIARDPSRIDAKRGNHFLQADLPVLNAPCPPELLPDCQPLARNADLVDEATSTRRCLDRE